jgi:ABC-2 type transport system permease protein
MSRVFNGTVASVTLRAALGRRRALLLAIPPAILVIVTLALKASHPPAPWAARVLGGFGFSVVLPLTALVVGTSVLGAEIEEGSIVHLLATPVRRSSVILTKYAVATVATMAFVAIPELVAGLIAAGGSGSLPLGLFAGALAGSVVYNAVFIMISVLTTRAVAVGLLYVLVWEGLLATLVSGARILSVGHYALGVANSIAHNGSLDAGLSLTTALVMGAVVTVGALALASRQLARFSLKGDAA